MEVSGIEVEEITYDIKSESAQLLLKVYAGSVQVRLYIDISKQSYDKILHVRNIALEAAQTMAREAT